MHNAHRTSKVIDTTPSWDLPITKQKQTHRYITIKINQNLPNFYCRGCQRSRSRPQTDKNNAPQAEVPQLSISLV